MPFPAAARGNINGHQNGRRDALAGIDGGDGLSAAEAIRMVLPTAIVRDSAARDIGIRIRTKRRITTSIEKSLRLSLPSTQRMAALRAQSAASATLSVTACATQRNEPICRLSFCIDGERVTVVHKLRLRFAVGNRRFCGSDFQSLIRCPNADDTRKARGERRRGFLRIGGVTPCGDGRATRWRRRETISQHGFVRFPGSNPESTTDERTPRLRFCDALRLA